MGFRAQRPAQEATGAAPVCSSPAFRLALTSENPPGLSDARPLATMRPWEASIKGAPEGRSILPETRGTYK